MANLRKHLELGREQLNRGEYSDALVHAKAALSLDSGCFEAHQLRIKALYLLKRDDEIMDALREAHNILRAQYPATMDDTPSWQDDRETEPEDDQEATFSEDVLEILLALRTRYPFDADLLDLLAALAEDTGRLELARETFEELINLDASQLDVWEGLVHVLSRLDLDEAQETVARALELFPTHPLFYEFQGFIYYRRRHFHQAIQSYRRAIAFGADYAENYQALVQCYLALGEQRTALDLMQFLCQRENNDTETYRFAIEVAIQCEQLEPAVSYAYQLMRLEPSHAETYSYKAWVEIAQHDWEAAERTLRLGFHKAMDGPFALYELVSLLISYAWLDEALRVADLAYELAPDHPESSACRGEILREQNALNEALAAFRQAASLAPRDDTYQTWIGIVLDNMGEYHAALHQFNQVLSRHPNDVWTLCNRGLTYLALEFPEKALADFNRGIEIDPQDAPLFFWRACTLVQLGDSDGSLRDLRRAVDLEDDIYSWLEQEPSLSPLYEDPRFQELLHQLQDGE